MITADVRRAIWDAASDAAADGELPAIGQADTSSLRPVPDALGGAPGRYASTLPFLLADPQRAARILARRLGELRWIAAAAMTAPGYLTLTITDDALAALAVRITEAGPACARSDILHAMTLPEPPPADLTTALSWPDASSMVAAEVSATLARAAGAAIVPPFHSERLPTSHSPAPASAAGIQAALAFAGPDAIRYALLRNAPTAPAPPAGPGWPGWPGWPGEFTAAGRRYPAGVEGSVRNQLDNPVYAVRYAHAHAASTLRQAADLGFTAGEATGFTPRLLSHTVERALLGALSWLPERVAGAARRGQPREFARYLEELAGAYHDCRETCPALPFGGRNAPSDQEAIQARLWLVTAAAAAVAASLALLGITAPDRL